MKQGILLTAAAAVLLVAAPLSLQAGKLVRDEIPPAGKAAESWPQTHRSGGSDRTSDVFAQRSDVRTDATTPSAKREKRDEDKRFAIESWGAVTPSQQ